MEIKYLNDGKEKYQSHEAVIDFSAPGCGHHLNLYVHTYGEDKEEAQDGLRIALEALRTQIEDVIKPLPAAT